MKLANKINELIQQGAYKVTSSDNGHHHEYEVDANGNGATTFTHNAKEHQHAIKDNKILKSSGHTHDLPKEDIADSI